MCLAMLGQISELQPRSDLATVEMSGRPLPVNVALLDREALQVGDWVLVHLGFALRRLDETEAASASDYLTELES